MVEQTLKKENFSGVCVCEYVDSFLLHWNNKIKCVVFNADWDICLVLRKIDYVEVALKACPIRALKA